MTRLSHLIRDYQDAGAICALINLYGFVDDGVFLTKSGDVGLVMVLTGIDDDCLDADQRQAVTRRFEAALRLCDEHTRLSQYLLKRRTMVMPDVTPMHAPLEAVLRRRRRFFEAKQRDLYEVDLYLVLLSEPPRHVDTWRARLRRAIEDPVTAVREWLLTVHTVIGLDEDLERRRVDLRHKTDAFVQQVQDPLRPRVLGKADAFRFFCRLLNYDPLKADHVRLREDTFLDYHTCDSALECHRMHLRLDDAYVRVLTLKEPPAQTFPHLFRALAEIPSNLILMNDWQREGAGVVRREIHAKRRHFHNAKVSLASYLTETAPAAGERLVDDSAAALVRDLGAALTEVTLHGRYFGHYTMTVVLYDTDPAALERSVGTCWKAFAAHDAQVTEERYNLLNAWLAVVPGNHQYNLRAMYLLNTNYADLSLLCKPDSGHETNPHLGRESLAILESPQGTPYHLNLHVEDVAHTLILGATGSGKSFFLNFLITHLQRYAPQTLIFDLGGSYESLTQFFGGRRLCVARDRVGVHINPFCLPHSTETLQFLFTFVKVLIQTDGQYTMSRADDQALYEQLETVYQLDPDQRRLFTLANILPRVLSQQLQRWVQGGQYADRFDSVEDTVTLASFQYIDFEGLERIPQVLEPLLFYLLHRASAIVVDPTRADTFKVFVIDEAWRFFRDPTVRLYLTDALKTWRKKNACVLLATQSSEDLERSELLRVVIESCPTKCFLANPNIDRPLYRDLFHLNETEADRIATLVPRQQVLLKQPDVAKVLTLNVDPETAALFSVRRPHLTA